MLINPNSRSGNADIPGVIEHLRQGGLDIVQETFSSPVEVSPDIVRRKGEVDCIIVCGGDGTLNSAAKGLMETGLPLGILPMGTANDLARTLGIPPDLHQAAEIIVAGRKQAIDLGEVNGHPFFNVASLGLSAELARGITPKEKKRFGRFGYALAALRVLAKARPFHAEIINKGERKRVKTLQIAVGNGRHYGGGMTVEENARIDDGHLDLYSLELKSVWKLAMLARSFREGRHGAWDEVRTAKCTEFEILTRRPRPINTDGELVTFTPAHFKLIPAAIQVYAPES